MATATARKPNIAEGLTAADSGEFEAARNRAARSRSGGAPAPQGRPMQPSSLTPEETASFNRQTGGRFSQQFPQAPTAEGIRATTDARMAGGRLPAGTGAGPNVSAPRAAALGEGVAAPAAAPRPAPAGAIGQAAGRAANAAGQVARMGAAPVQTVPGRVAPRTAPGQRGGTGAFLGTVAAGSAVDSLSRDTADYRKRIGLGEYDADDSNLEMLGKDLAVRTLGVGSDLGANILDIGTGVLNTGRRAFGYEPISTFGSHFADSPEAQAGVAQPADFSNVVGAVDTTRADATQRQQRQQANAGITPVADRTGDPGEVLGSFNGRPITRADSDRLAASVNTAPAGVAPSLGQGVGEPAPSPSPASPGQGAEERLRDITDRSTPAGRLYARLAQDTTPTGKRMAGEFLSAYVGSGTVERGQDSARNTSAAEAAAANSRSAASDAAGVERERIAANRRAAPQYQIAEDGSIIQLGDGVAQPVLGPDGKPFRTKRGGGYTEKDITERLEQLDPGGVMTVEERRAERDRIVAELQAQAQALADGA